MKTRLISATFIALLIVIITSLPGCAPAPPAEELAGEWKGIVQFKSGMYAEIKDLLFMRVFNEGGTMTESSNYDSAPPVPPAYGIWRKTGGKQYETKYEFFTTNLPASFEDISKGGGFTPSGHGLVSESITLSEDGKSYSSVIRLTVFDKSGKEISSDQADAKAERMVY